MPSAVDLLVARGIPAEAVESALGVMVRTDAARTQDAVAVLWEVGCDFFVDLFGTDTGEGVELTYHVRELATRSDLYLRCLVPYDGEIASVWRTYPAALYPEREAAELLGLTLSGHPNPKRLLTTEELGPMLRRDRAVRSAGEVQLPYE